MSGVRTIGIFGGGQLGMYLAAAARRLGIAAVVLDPDPACPAARTATAVIQGRAEDAADARRLGRACDAVVLDNEHVPASCVAEALQFARHGPAPRFLARLQDRLGQRRMLAALGAPQPPFDSLETPGDLARLGSEFPFPAVLKTRRGGYDGRGQAVARTPGELAAAWDTLGRRPVLVEAFVAFEREVSAVVVRDRAGRIEPFPVAENEHRRGALRLTRVPARASAGTASEAVAVASAVAAASRHTGTLAVEFFVVDGGRLLVNEVAPRVHNSAHFTLDACSHSQFEQHVRAAAGLPLGVPAMRGAAAMVNLFGDLWQPGHPDVDRAVAGEPGAVLRMYGKRMAAPGRKMGHVTVVSPHDRPEDATQTALRILGRLERGDCDPGAFARSAVPVPAGGALA